MHTYATNSPLQPRLMFVIAVIAIGATLLLGRLTHWIEGNWGYEVGGFSSMAVFGVLYFVFDRWLWRLPVVRNLLLVPNLNGTWDCAGRTTVREGDQVDTPWSAEISITQSWSRMIVRLKATQSSSQSIAASLYHQPGSGYRLIYHYENTPKVDQPGLHHHAGLCDLTFSADLSKVEGHYFTGLDRQTIGTMTLTKKGSNQ